MAVAENVQKPLNIAYVSGHAEIPSRDANNVHLMKMCAAYAGLGQQVTLIVSSNRNPYAGDVPNVFAHYGVRPAFQLKQFPVPPNRIGKQLSLGIGMPLLARRLGADLVHTRNLVVAWGCVRFAKLPVLLEFHDDPIKSERARRLLDVVIRGKSTVGLVTITQALARQIQAGVKGSVRMLVAPDGVDQAWLKADTSREDARRELALDCGTKRLAVYTGHLYPGKGVELIAAIASSLHEYEVVIVGGTETDIDRCKRLVGDADNVRFIGHCVHAQVRLYQRAADVLLLPLADAIQVAGGQGGNIARFTSPLKLFEYMAADRPLIASTLPVLQEILTDGRNSLLVPYHEPERWVAALNALAANPDLGAGIAAQARRDVEAYTWEKRAQRILAFATASAHGQAQRSG